MADQALIEVVLANAFAGDTGSQILQGSVGWDDEEEYVFLGTDDNDGYTLIRVQLFEGRDYTKPLNPARAQGHKIICHISGNLFRVPPKDTRVFVAVEKGREHVPGAGVIFATIEKSPKIQFGKKKVKMDFGADYDLVIKARSVTITDYDNQQVSLGPEGGVQVFDKEGGGVQFKEGAGYCMGTEMNFVVHDSGAVKALLNLSTSATTLVGGDGMIKMGSGQVTVNTGKFMANAATVCLGSTATPAFFCARYPLAGPTPQPSTSVFIGA